MPVKTTPSASLPGTPENFRALFKTHAAGVSIITTKSDVGPVGLTLTSISSVSADPPTIAFSVMKSSSCWPVLSKSSTILLHLLDEDHHDLAKRFSTSGIDRFQGVDWVMSRDGVPLLLAARRWAICTVIGRHEAGASQIIVASLGETMIGDGPGPLLYHGSSYRRLGAELPAAI